MRRRLGVWLLLLLAALGLLAAKREAVADGWLRMALSSLMAAERPRLEAQAAFGAERFRAAAASDDPRMIVAAARYLNWIEGQRVNPLLNPMFRIDLPEVPAGEIDALIRRAATLGADDPVVWSQLAQICEHGWLAVPRRDCPVEAHGAIARLAALEPGNGWSALLELERLQADDPAPAGSAPAVTDAARAAAIDAALARLADSDRVDGHEAAMLEVHRRIFDGGDWPATLVDAQPAREVAIGTFGALLVRLVAPAGRVVVGQGPPYGSIEEARDELALRWVMTDHRLVGMGLSEACSGDLPETRLALCRRSAERMTRGSTTALELTGLRLAIRLAPDAETAAAARVAMRLQRWRQAQFLKLFDPTAPTFLPDAQARITALWIETGREGEACARLVEAQGLLPTPPDGWTAPDEARWSQGPTAVDARDERMPEGERG
jgi:hypothetical protein